MARPRSQGGEALMERPVLEAKGPIKPISVGNTFSACKLPVFIHVMIHCGVTNFINLAPEK